MKSLLFNLAAPVLAIPRPFKRLIALTVDFCLCVLSVWIAYYLRLGEVVSFFGGTAWDEGSRWAAFISVTIALPLFAYSGLYRAIFRHSDWPALTTVARAVGVYTIVYFTWVELIGVDGVPRTLGILQPLVLLFLIGGSRMFARIWLGGEYLSILKAVERPKVLIYGAGNFGRQLARAISQSREMLVLGFLDDDDRLHGHVLSGLPIYDPAQLPRIAASSRVNDVLLAMPRLNRGRRNEILDRIRSAHVSVRTLPGVTDLVKGKVSVADLRELDIDDLLAREPVMPSQILLSMNVSRKAVMVSGAGGSIGSELCRQMMAIKPRLLLLVDQSEFALYEIHHELTARAEELGVTVIPLLGSVQDQSRMSEIMNAWRPDTVYHAAAYKHVPLVEQNLSEGIRNNVMGTLRAANAAIDSGVKDFVLVSTDKAVRPTSVMGASKRLAEMVLQALAAKQANTKFSMVRFGNVLGSSGSVVPKFRQQIRDGGPISLTHPEVTRYFMTIPEAAQLVIQAGAMAKGGDVFVLDMGQPVKIMDLARRMVELSGLTVKDEQNPEGDIVIAVTGLRPGEKLYEELLIGDNPLTTLHPRIMKSEEDFITWPELEDKLNALEMALNVNDAGVIRLMMSQLVTGYTASENIVDWVYLEQEASRVAGA